MTKAFPRFERDFRIWHFLTQSGHSRFDDSARPRVKARAEKIVPLSSSDNEAK
jgi:hypothetical protein